MLDLIEDSQHSYELRYPLQWNMLGGRECWERLAMKAYQSGENVSDRIVVELKRRFPDAEKAKNLPVLRMFSYASTWHITAALRDDAIRRLSSAKAELQGYIETQVLFNDFR